jgi:hypothetical protein
LDLGVRTIHKMGLEIQREVGEKECATSPLRRPLSPLTPPNVDAKSNHVSYPQ